MVTSSIEGGDAQPESWPLWQRVLFRFFFAYWLIQIAPWNMFSAIPGVPFIVRWYRQLVGWVVQLGNAQFFHVRDTLIMPNGSGDTSFAWRSSGCSSVLR